MKRVCGARGRVEMGLVSHLVRATVLTFLLLFAFIGVTEVFELSDTAIYISGAVMIIGIQLSFYLDYDKSKFW